MVVNKGNPSLMGCTKINRSYNFSFASEEKKIALLIFDTDKNQIIEKIEMDETYKTGNVFSCKLSGQGIDRCFYCYQCNGRYIVDPYAKTVTGCEIFAQDINIENFKVQKNENTDDKKERPLYLSRVELEKFDWEDDEPLNIPFSECIFYKLNVRGFTKSCTSATTHKGTFQGIIEKIPYLKKLGITTLELMPAYEFDENHKFEQFNLYKERSQYISVPIKEPVNYWGYVNGFHFAPKAAFSSIASVKDDYTIEFKKMVKKLHKAGIEVVMEMYFTDETSGLIMDCMKYWVINYHIDGIHLYAKEEVLNTAAEDPLLSNTKIITVYWNGACHTIKNMANYNDGYMNTARKFLKGDENQLADFVNAARNNPLQSANINYITNHNGFTMYDLVSYDRKHNEANGENNSDGENFNYSWNCGAEGRTRKKKIVELRQRQIKNAFMLVLLSQGTPLILAGDEFENTQNGNNNPYCVDSETSWLNWKKSDYVREMTEFVQKLIGFRKSHKILHMDNQLLVSDQLTCGYPDVSYHGSSAWYNAMENYNRHIGMMYCSKYAKGENENSLIYVGYNMHWESHELALPKIPEKNEWVIELCSGNADNDVVIKQKRSIWLAPKTITVLVCNLDKECVKNHRKTKKKRKE